TRRERLEAVRAVQHRYRPNRREFERLVALAIAELPVEFRERMKNVAVTVMERPPQGSGGGNEADRADALLGLYQGTPLVERGSNEHMSTPDRITIYRGPIVAQCATRAALLREIRDTVWHEVGHFFGLDDSDLP